jgi:hypothetical protein
MAINDKAQEQTPRQSAAAESASIWIDPYRTLAAVGSMVLGAAAVLPLVYGLIFLPGASDIPLCVVLALLGVISFCFGAALRSGSPSAQKPALWILLVFWLLVTLAGALQVFAALIWEGWCLLPDMKILAY